MMMLPMNKDYRRVLKNGTHELAVMTIAKIKEGLVTSNGEPLTICIENFSKFTKETENFIRSNFPEKRMTLRHRGKTLTISLH